MAVDESVSRRVRSLLERANHRGTPQAEAETALALAYRLMVKYGLDQSQLKSSVATDVQQEPIDQRIYWTVGPYRVRRSSLRYQVARCFSCAAYRDFDDGSNSMVALRVFGTKADLDSAEVVYEAAHMLAHRVMPSGDRGYRTSWWHGFTSSIVERLTMERGGVTQEVKGSALVLRDREDRATVEMERVAPDLVKGRPSTISWESAFEDGRRAGSTFSTGRRGVGRTIGELDGDY